MHEADRTLAVQYCKIELAQSDGWIVGVLQNRIQLLEQTNPVQTSEWLSEWLAA